MLESIRAHRRWLMLFFLILVVPSFVFFGMQGYSRFVEGDQAVARIGGQPITPQEFDNAQRQRLDQLRQMLGPNFDARLFDTAAARAATLDNLLAERALFHEATRANVVVSDERLREVIGAVPAFQQDGKFDYDRYRTLLAAQGLNEAAFEQRVRNDIVQQTLLRSIADTALVPNAVRERLLKNVEEQREVRELRFRPEDFAKQVKIDDGTIEAYYKKNTSQFEVPERVRAEYVVLKLEDVAKQISVPEAEARAYYEQNKQRYGQQEERRVAHILITAGEGGSVPDKAAAKKLAEELLTKVRAKPESFAALAREYSKDPESAAKGGELQLQFTPTQGTGNKTFDDAVFKLAQGQISDVIETDFGFHILRVTAVKPAQVKPFEAVRGEIEVEYRRQQAQRKFAEAAETFSNTVYEQADSLAPAAGKLQLEVKTADNVTRQGASPQAASAEVLNPRVIEALFAPESLKDKRNTEAIEVAPNTLVAARVVAYQPPAVKPLADVRTEIRARLEREEAARLAREAGENKLAELKASMKPGAQAAGFGQTRTVSRIDPLGLPDNALKAILQVPADKLPGFVGAALDGGTYGVFQVLSARAPANVDAARRDGQARSWQQAVGGAEDLAYIEALKTKYKAEVLKPELRKPAAEEAAKKDDGKVASN